MLLYFSSQIFFMFLRNNCKSQINIIEICNYFLFSSSIQLSPLFLGREIILAYAAERAGEVVGKIFTHIFIVADGAAPYSLALWCRAHSLGFWLDLVLVILIGAGRRIRENCHEGRLADEESV